MEVKRTIKTDVDSFEVGDVIKFKLTDGEKVQAKAVKETPGGMLFVLVDCLTKEYPMFYDIDDMNEDDITYMNSDLRKALNGEILTRFPKEIRSRMVAVNAEGDMLRIPSKMEIFGGNVYEQIKNKKVKRWKLMKECRNRIAFRGKEGTWEWYWLMDNDQECASSFTLVSCYGGVLYSNASMPRGVRPVFCLYNLVDGKRKFTVGFNVQGCHFIDVTAPSTEEAIRTADSRMYASDFGDLLGVNWDEGRITDGHRW